MAYQAGAVRALAEAGLRFHHADGTSGGIMNLAMILSGQDPLEMWERWRTLDQRQFMSLLPLRQYVRSFRWPALGSSDGVRQKVFPHLGIDVARIHAAEGIVGTFNVCNFSQKVAEVVEHTAVDIDMLVAGISLPIVMPAVTRDGEAYHDAVWIRDSNVAEAVRRGADEVWLVWCIGNTPEYLNGSFRQYVHMIEVAANASLFADFEKVEQVNRQRENPVVLHIVRPGSPIPLDPDYFLGRIDAGMLLEMGYRDACGYLERADPKGVRWQVGATAMAIARPAVLLRPRLAGTLGGEALEVQLAPEIPDAASLAADSNVCARATGHVTVNSVGTKVPFRSARASLGADGRLSFEATLGPQGGRCCLFGEAALGSRSVSVTLCQGAKIGGPVLAKGDVAIDGLVAWSALRTAHVTNAVSFGDRWRAIWGLARVAVHHLRRQRRTAGKAA